MEGELLLVANASFLILFLGEEYLVCAEVVFEDLTEKTHHSALLFFAALPLQHLLEVPQLEDVPAAHLCELDLIQFLFQ
jgi:hypothetical protein